MQLQKGDKFYAVYITDHNSAIDIDQYKFLDYSMHHGVGYFTGSRVKRRSDTNIFKDFQGYQIGLTKEEAILNYLYERFFHYFLSFFGDDLPISFAKTFKKTELGLFNTTDSLALNTNIARLLDYHDISDKVIEFIDNKILEPNFFDNTLIKLAKRKNYKTLYKYLENSPDVIATAIEFNQEEFLPKNITDVFLF